MTGVLIVFLIIFCLAVVALCGWCYDRSKYKNMLIERTIERDHYYDVVCDLTKGYCNTVFDDVVDLLYSIKIEEQPIQLEVCFLSNSVEDTLPNAEWFSEVILPQVESKIYFKYIEELYKKLQSLDVSINCELSELDPTKRFISIIEKENK